MNRREMLGALLALQLAGSVRICPDPITQTVKWHPGRECFEVYTTDGLTKDWSTLGDCSDLEDVKTRAIERVRSVTAYYRSGRTPRQALDLVYKL